MRTIIKFTDHNAPIPDVPCINKFKATLKKHKGDYDTKKIKTYMRVTINKKSSLLASLSSEVIELRLKQTERS